MTENHDDDIPLLFAMRLNARFDPDTAYVLNRSPIGITLSIPENPTKHEKAKQARLMEETKALISGYCRKETQQINATFCADVLMPIFHFTKEDYGHFETKDYLIKLNTITPETSPSPDEEEEEEEEEEGAGNSNSEPALASSIQKETPDRPRPRVKYLNK